MGEAAHEIEAHIAETRVHLGEDLRALEKRFKSYTDWRTYTKGKPGAVLGVLLAGGIALAVIAGKRRRKH